MYVSLCILNSPYLTPSAECLFPLIRGLKTADRDSRRDASSRPSLSSLIPKGNYPSADSYNQNAPGFPILVTSAFTGALDIPSSSLGCFCTFPPIVLLSCNVEMDNDKGTSVNKDVRQKLAAVLDDTQGVKTLFFSSGGSATR